MVIIKHLLTAHVHRNVCFFCIIKTNFLILHTLREYIKCLT